MSFALYAVAGCGTVDGPFVPVVGPDETDPGTGPDPGPTAACKGLQMPDGDQVIELTSGGVDRAVLVHMPPDYDPSVPVPLVMAYHFVGSAPASMSQLTGLNAAADAAGMLLAYPVGVNGSFNAGKCCGKAWEDGIDDVAFTREVLDSISNTYCVDATRVYAAGMSNGAMMAYRLGCELADRFAGVASVAGALHLDGSCAPSRPVPMLAVHGTADAVVPFEGGQGQPPFPVAGDFVFTSVADSVDVYRTANGCSDFVEETHHQGGASCRRFTTCESAAPVEICVLDGGGHTWPGGSFPDLLGETSMDLDASTKIMTFFRDLPAK
jgi:polyhydroxybutyrate depolymerase